MVGTLRPLPLSWPLGPRPSWELPSDPDDVQTPNTVVDHCVGIMNIKQKGVARELLRPGELVKRSSDWLGQ